MITREIIEKRLAELKSGRQQLLLNVNATDGAIQDCEWWLTVLNVDEMAHGQPAPEAATSSNQVANDASNK